MQEAATLLDVTVSAIRMRIQRGTLQSEKDSSGRVYVWLTPDNINPHSEGNRESQTPPATRELIDELRNRIESLESANRENRRIIAALTQRIPELPPQDTSQDTPPEPRESPQAASEEPPGIQQAPQEEERRSWWRRLFGSL